MFKYFTILPKKHDEENQEINYLTYHGGLVVFLALLLLSIHHGLIVNLVVIQNTGEGVHNDIWDIENSFCMTI